MNKPSTIVYEEFKRGLATLINNSGLPAFIIESVLQNFLNEAMILSQRQYEFDKIEYEKHKDDKETE